MAHVRLISAMLLLAGTLLAAPEQPLTKCVDDAYPRAATGTLRLARLAELPEQVVLRCGEVELKIDDLDATLGQISPFLRRQVNADPVLLLELAAGRRLLPIVARRDLAARNQPPAASDEAAIQRFTQLRIATMQPTEEEIADFYKANATLFGTASFENVKPHITHYLLDEYRRSTIDNAVRSLSSELDIEVSAAWMAQAAPKSLDNPIEHARAARKPLLVAFESASCCGTEGLKPILDDLAALTDGSVTILRFDMRQHQVLAMRYHIDVAPTLIGYDTDGDERFRQTTLLTAEELLSLVELHATP